MKKRVSRPFIVVCNNMWVILAGRSPPRTNLSSTWKFQIFSRSNWGCVDPWKQKTRWSGWVPSVICSNWLGRLVLLFIIPLVFGRNGGFWVGWNFHRISHPTTTEIRRKPGHSRRDRPRTILFDGWSGLPKQPGPPGRVWKIQTSLFFSNPTLPTTTLIIQRKVGWFGGDILSFPRIRHFFIFKKVGTGLGWSILGDKDSCLGESISVWVWWG